MKKQDLVIIGGGIMGLMTAYYASSTGTKVTILEKRKIGNKDAASFSLTRSIRSDYLDPLYATLSTRAKQLWEELEKKTSKKFYIKSGCLNIAKENITPVLNKSYGANAYKNLKFLKIPVEKFSKQELDKKFNQFSVDAGHLDPTGGFLYLPTITKIILAELKKNKVRIFENVNIEKIAKENDDIAIETSKNKLVAKKIIITVGIWTNEVLQLIENCSLQFPITVDKPSECKYYIPSKENFNKFTEKNFPVFAYLDVGVYGHPIFAGKTPGVKISFYNPPDVKKTKTKIVDIKSFVNECLPELEDAKVIDVKNADQCSYDMVKDKNFIVGKLPGFENIFVGMGWNGTGYKFAPVIGTILSELSLIGKTKYKINGFDPERFKNYETK